MSMSERYNIRESERKWQAVWKDKRVFETKNEDARPTYYVLEMFPYPSGRIHMGHVRNYAMGDVVARYRRAKGFNVPPPHGLGRLRPAGRERRHGAQGSIRRSGPTPISRRCAPSCNRWACRSTGSREFATCDPDYYKHQQRLFLDFLAAGLVDRKTAKVNWDPVDQTVLANEQVVDGRGWRSGARSSSAS